VLFERKAEVILQMRETGSSFDSQFMRDAGIGRDSHGRKRKRKQERGSKDQRRLDSAREGHLFLSCYPMQSLLDELAALSPRYRFAESSLARSDFKASSFCPASPSFPAAVSR
jgi:hypothetical protein